MNVRELIKKLLDFNQDSLVFALTKQDDLGDVVAQKVPEVLIGTVGDSIVIVSDFEKYRKDEEKQSEES